MERKKLIHLSRFSVRRVIWNVYKNLDDEIGKRYGRLTIISYAVNKRTDKKGNRYFLCRCDCGREKEIMGYNIRNGHSSSCGCQTYKTQSSHRQWTGCGEIYGTYYNAVRNNAKHRNLSFDISINEMWLQFLKQDRKCALTGLLLTLPSKSKDTSATASLDRIDSTKGYVLNNIQWIHKDLQAMKMNMSETKFKSYCRLVVNCVDKNSSSS